MIFRLGDRIEDEVVELLQESGLRVTEQQRVFHDFGGFFRGHWDGRIEGVTKRPHVLEIKSANEERFKEFRKKTVAAANPVYAAQVQVYMGYSGLDRALWVVYCKNNSAVYTERAYFSREAFTALREKAWRIITANQAPARTFADPEDVHCQWCDHRTLCWEPEDFVMADEDRHCRNCTYFAFAGLDLYCTFPAHALPLVRRRWTDPHMVCQDYLSAYGKGIDRQALPTPATINYTPKHQVIIGGSNG